MSTTPISKDIIDFIKKEIKAIDEELFQLQHSIWEKPELKYEEYHAHQVLTDYIEKQEGWTVEKHAFNLETAFVATFAIDAEKNPAVISFNSEYDALPGIGHACGHNLIAVCGLTGAIATALAMKSSISQVQSNTLAHQLKKLVVVKLKCLKQAHGKMLMSH